MMINQSSDSRDLPVDIGKEEEFLTKVLRNIHNLSLILLGIISFWLIPQQLLADDVSVSSSVSADKIGIEDSFTYTITVETSSNKDLNVEVNFDNFPADYLRPSVSNSMSTSFVNGRMSSSRSQSHKYTVYPRNEGILNIPQIEVEVNGKKYQTKSHKIEVVEGSLRSQTQTPSRNNSPFSSFFDDPWADNTPSRRNNNSSFVVVELSRDSLYVGQNVDVKYTYYTLNNNYNINYDMQTFDGYGIESSETINENWERTKYKGRNYLRREIVTLNLSVQEAGQLTLPMIVVNESVIFNRNSYKSPTTKLLVKELPKKGKAIDFSNAIGEFTIKSELNQSIMFENQQNQLQVTIKGRGNFPKILYPEIQAVDGLEILKPKATMSLDAKDSGTLILTYDIIPSESGKFRIPPVSLNYFDDVKEDYQTIYTESSLLTVKSSNGTGNISDQKESNVFFTRNKPYLGNISREYLLINKFTYWLMLSILLLSIIGYMMYINVQKKRMSDLGFVRKREALSILKTAVEESQRLVEKNDILFYTNAQNNLLKFIAKVTKASLQLSQNELIQELEKSSLNKVTVGKINSFLTYCEQIKYRPNFQSNENIQNDYQKFLSIYNEIKNS